MKKEKSIKNLETKGFGSFTKTFGKKVVGGDGAPTYSLPEIVINVPKKGMSIQGDLEIDETNDGPY